MKRILQGSWKGQETGANSDRLASLVFSGTNVDFHGVGANDWCNGTFSLRADTNPKQMVFILTGGPSPEYVGKSSHAIYRIKEGALTISGNEPGNPDPPTAFDAPQARQFVFKVEKP